MKIIYLNIGNPQAGVQKKLSDKISRLNSFPGIEVTHFQILPNREPSNMENTVYAYSGLANRIARWPFFWRLSVIVQQMKIYESIKDFIKRASPDLIIMRYPGADFFLWRFLATVKGKVVFEHNTLELEELKLRAHDSYWYNFFYWNERFFGKLIRRKAAGLVGVTNEITERQAELARNRVPACTISNGIDVERISIRNGLPYYPGQRLNLLFLAGSQAPWHGIDILINSIELNQNDNLIHCLIAGNIDAASSERISKMKNVVHYDTIYGQALDRAVETSHIGIGSLALFRNNMKEACTLKVREYWARCLPFVIGYNDTDVMACPSVAPFCLKVEIDKNTLTLDMNQIIKFAERAYSTPNMAASFRKSALDQIDYSIKSVAYVDFLKKL